MKRPLAEGSVNFVRTTALLEEVREQLAYEAADRLLEEYERELGEEIPPEVKAASREAFAHSGLHGLAASDMDPHAHQVGAAKKHQDAAAMARKHGLTKLVHQHQKMQLGHEKKAAKLEPEESASNIKSSPQGPRLGKSRGSWKYDRQDDMWYTDQPRSPINPSKKYPNQKHPVSESEGPRVELHPGHDLWMQGARYGNIIKSKGDKHQVKLDKVSKPVWVHRDMLKEI
jgi:hypothetical protein